MTLRPNTTRLTDALELLISNGFDELEKSLKILLDIAMLIERERHLGAGHYECTEDRQGYANGFKPKTVRTGVGRWSCPFPKRGIANFILKAWKRGSGLSVR